MAGYSPKDVSLSLPESAISGVVTNQVISKIFPVTEGGSLNFVVKIVASGVTVVGSITAKLQTAIDGSYVDSKTVTIAANGSFYIKLNVEVTADQTFLPLLSSGRVVITTTNAGDAAVIGSISTLQAL